MSNEKNEEELRRKAFEVVHQLLKQEEERVTNQECNRKPERSETDKE